MRLPIAGAEFSWAAAKEKIETPISSTQILNKKPLIDC
jgi:hypothetical protein